MENLLTKYKYQFLEKTGVYLMDKVVFYLKQFAVLNNITKTYILQNSR